MKILLVNQFFWPDSAATSQLLTDLARALAAEGHSVHVVCGANGYATVDASEPPPVAIHRAPTLPFARGAIARVLSYGSFLAAAMWQGLRAERADLVITLTTPPLLSWVGTVLQVLRGSRYFIWEMDVYPDVAVDCGYLPAKGWLTRLIGMAADYSRRRADGILVLGECMHKRLQARGIPASKLHITENWADSRFVQAQPQRSGGVLKLLYSGNLGLAHDVETLRGALGTLGNDDRFEFIFAGGGARRAELERWCAARQLRNVAFRSYSNRAGLGESLGEGDIGLVTQQPACVGSVVPSKTYGLMAARRPILFVGPQAAQPGLLVKRWQCGWQVECGDSMGLIALLEELWANRQLVVAAGDRGHAAFTQQYDLPHGTSRIVAVVGAAAPSAPSALLRSSASSEAPAFRL